MNDLYYNLTVWIQKTLSIPSSTFNNLPACPYAKKAWMDNKVKVKEFKSWVDAYGALLTEEFDLIENDVIIFAFPSDNITPYQLSSMLDKALSTWEKDDIVVLEDHPDDLEEVDGFKLNFGKCCLLLIQSRSKLEEAREYLDSKKYYKNWTKEYKEAVQSR
tara:strand:+ start:3852 stop:4334 length:483 start_codon:yes stop_codon:yes gene_type:complete